MDQFGDRKPPSAAYATVSPIFHEDKKGLFIGGNFWDGRATGEVLGNPAADQAQGPFLNPVEQALPDSACVVYRVCNPVVLGRLPRVLRRCLGFRGSAASPGRRTSIAVCATEGTTVTLSDADRAKSDDGLRRHRAVDRRLRGFPRGQCRQLQIRPEHSVARQS